MQTLGIDAGRTEEERAASRELHQAELRDDVRSSANYFFLAAGFALLTSGVLPLRVALLIDVGMIELLYFYGKQFGADQGLVIALVSLVIISLLVGLGAMARLYTRWPFFVGLILYGADMIALVVTFSFWSLGVHAYFLLKWYQGQRAAAELQRTS
jgi:hypothetical protein